MITVGVPSRQRGSNSVASRSPVHAVRVPRSALSKAAITAYGSLRTASGAVLSALAQDGTQPLHQIRNRDVESALAAPAGRCDGSDAERGLRPAAQSDHGQPPVRVGYPRTRLVWRTVRDGGRSVSPNARPRTQLAFTHRGVARAPTVAPFGTTEIGRVGVRVDAHES